MSHRSGRKGMLERLDDSVRWTGIPAFAVGHPRRRSLRWPSVVVLVLAVAGLLVDLGQPNLWWGYAMLMLGFGVANLMPILGPVKPWGGPERVDESDRALRARAFLAAFSALAAVAVIGLWAIVGLSLVQGWTADALRSTIMKLAFVQATIYTAGPTCYASWARAPIDDED
jgi:cytochrome bd-type quinol oxidase subunit 2